MAEVRASISLLRFRAGSLHLGIAAEDIVQIDKTVDGNAIHIASLLGVESSGSECRTVALLRPPTAEGGPASLSFLVDTPLEVVQCDLDSLLPLPRGASFQRWRPVMGFARLSEQLVLVLDISSLFSSLTDRYQRGLS